MKTALTTFLLAAGMIDDHPVWAQKKTAAPLNKAIVARLSTQSLYSVATDRHHDSTRVRFYSIKHDACLDVWGVDADRNAVIGADEIVMIQTGPRNLDEQHILKKMAADSVCITRYEEPNKGDASRLALRAAAGLPVYQDAVYTVRGTQCYAGDMLEWAMNLYTGLTCRPR